MRIISVLLGLLLTGFATTASAQITCTSAATAQGLLTPNAFLYITSSQHNTEVGGAPIIERYQWRVYDESSGNPDTGPFIVDIPLARAMFTAVPGVSNCFRTTPSPSGIPANTGLKSIVIPVGRTGWGMGPRSEPSNSFLQPLLLAVGAVRVG